MKVYLAGPMRGYPELNFPAFMAGAKHLRAHGHEVFNPAENDIEKGYAGKPVKEVMRDCILDDLTYIVREAEVIALLPGWEKSAGVQAELATAIFLGLQVWHIPQRDVEENIDDRVEQVSG